MSDPKRLLTSSDADPAALELLKSLRSVAPDPSVSVATWPAMAAKVAALPVAVAPPASVAPPAPVAPPPAVAAASKLLALKWLGIAAASGSLGAGALWLRAKAPAAASAPHVISTDKAQLAAPVSALPADKTVENAPLAARLDGSPDRTSPASAAVSTLAPTRSSRLDAEASLVAKARSALRRGDPHAALATLNELQSSFANGGLMQEREVLAVEVLAANGNAASAQRRASAFIAAHPTSPYSAKLQRFAQAP